jgi:hypothetical protein
MLFGFDSTILELYALRYSHVIGRLPGGWHRSNPVASEEKVGG